ncbi:response regulator [Nocardia sp. NPDC004722]
MILGAADDIEVAVTTDGAGAVAAIQAADIQVVLLDIRMPDVDGLQILSELLRSPEPPNIAMLTTFAADEYIAEALKRGAAGFILKDTEPQYLAPIVRALASGAVVMSPKVKKTVVEEYLGNNDGTARAMIETLNARERDIIVLIAEGLSNADIGVRLHLSVGTVKDCVGTIFNKLNISTRVQAALIAERAGLVPHEKT